MGPMASAHPRLLDYSASSPAENLALDEALLRSAGEAIGGGSPAAENEWLRFWESGVPFVVLGVSGKWREEIREEACAADSIPILRRASGGGTVVQGRGCLNFSLVLSIGLRPELRDVHGSYRHIIDRVARALGPEGAALAGTSDLAIDGIKISGNAQKRSRDVVLHHGTVLYDFDLSLLDRYLAHPPREPEYRKGRSHRDFCRNLSLGATELRGRIAEEWRACASDRSQAIPAVDALVAEKYGRDDWNLRF